MIRDYRLSELAEVLSGELLNDDLCVSGITIDSRNVNPGDLFIAIKGPKFDGHAYLQQAIEAGAAAVLVQDSEKAQSLPGIVVRDTFKALGMIGHYNRENFSHPVLAITGSCGKTSVKEMLAAICSEVKPTLATEGNLNNAFGAPLTLSRIQSEHGFAVIELGTSSPGEIQYIAELTRPDVAVITNADETHLDKLVNVEGVAHEKGFILDALKPGGTAVLNQDDVFFEQWRQRVAGSEGGRRVVSFSCENPEADCYASGIESTAQGMSFKLHLSGRSVGIDIAFWGQHQVQNACCAAAIALSAGISVDSIVQGLGNARPFQRRGQRYQLSERSMVIDETYNANPRATFAALDQLADCQGTRVMVLGDMLDLGEVAEIRHREMGEYARHLGIDYFAGYGSAARLAVEEFGEAGRHFDDKAALSTWVSALLNVPADSGFNHDINLESAEKTTVLVKGSRGMEMLDIVRTLVGPKYKGER